MRYDTILFDFDGTVMETGPGVLNAVRYALGKLGCPFPAVPERLFMGPPLEFSFREYCRLPEAEISEAIRLYRVYYDETGLYECDLYPGMRELLRSLRAKGARLFTASSKPEEFVRRILVRFDCLDAFDFIGGADFAGTRSTKTEVLAYTLRAGNVTDRSRALMVGDRKYDILGAKAFQLASCGVLFGYGDREELLEAGADWLAETAEDIERIVCDA